MKILLTVAVWGRDYANLLAKYSVPSQITPNNLPRLALAHDVTCHFVTTRADRDWLRDQPAILRLSEHCDIAWELMEEHGVDPKNVPVGVDNRKYPFLSRLQNLAFTRSEGFDAIVFNYADFIWADGSLDNTVTTLGKDA